MTEKLDLIVPTLFGTEAFVVRELKRIGYDEKPLLRTAE